MKRFIIKLPITLLFFTSFALSISLYGMKSGETDARGAATAPAAPPSVIDSESPVTDEHKEAAGITDGIRDLKISKSDEATFLRYLFFETPYRSGSIRGVRSPAPSIIWRRFYCSDETINPAAITDFFNEDPGCLPCSFLVHESQTNLTIALSKRPHFALSLRETAMVLKTANFADEKWLTLKSRELAPYTLMSWDELDTFVKYSDTLFVQGEEPDKRAEDQKIFITYLASYIPRERIHFYSVGSDDDRQTCLTIDHPETRTVSIHFFPIKHPKQCKCMDLLVQIVTKAKKDGFVNVVMFVTGDWKYYQIEGLGFRPINEQNGYRVHYFHDIKKT